MTLARQRRARGHPQPEPLLPLPLGPPLSPAFITFFSYLPGELGVGVVGVGVEEGSLIYYFYFKIFIIYFGCAGS